MKHAVFSALLICCLSWGCDDNKGASGSQAGSSSTAGSPGSSGADELGGQSSGAGSANGGAGSANGGAGSANGGAGSANGGAGSANGGAGNTGAGGSHSAGAPTGGSGFGNAGAAGQTQWPKWVSKCAAIRAAGCADCYTSDCVVCIYGTDEERASTGVSCDEPLSNYKEYCTCNKSGCPTPCRPEYQ